MLTDFLLAALHHLLIFGLVAMLVTEAVLLRGAIDAGTVRRLAGLDRGYGITALALLVVGGLRVFYGIKGYDFYLHNPWFHAKLGAYILVALLSIAPTLNFIRWRKALRADPSFLPDPAQIGRARTLVRIELALVAVIFVLAAGMARHGGL